MAENPRRIITPAELEALKAQLAQLSPAEMAAVTGAGEKKILREIYNAQRNEIANSIGEDADALSKIMAQVKAEWLNKIIKFKDSGKDYAGRIRKDDNGGYSFTNDAQTVEIKYTVNKRYIYNELARQAEALIKEWIADMIQADSKPIYKMFADAIQRTGKNSTYDRRQIEKLYPYKDEIADERFKRAIELFQEACFQIDSKAYINIYTRKTPQDEFEIVKLSMSSL